LMPLPEARAEDAHDLIFTPGPDEARMPVRRPPPPAPRPTADILAQLAQPRPAPMRVEEPAGPPVDPAEREALIERVLREILEDPDASFRTVAVLYQDFLVRCR